MRKYEMVLGVFFAAMVVVSILFPMNNPELDMLSRIGSVISFFGLGLTICTRRIEELEKKNQVLSTTLERLVADSSKKDAP